MGHHASSDTSCQRVRDGLCAECGWTEGTEARLLADCLARAQRHEREKDSKKSEEMS